MTETITVSAPPGLSAYELYAVQYRAAHGGSDVGMLSLNDWLTTAGGNLDSQVALAQAWAEGTLPGGGGTKSAKEWATESAAAASIAPVLDGWGIREMQFVQGALFNGNFATEVTDLASQCVIRRGKGCLLQVYGGAGVQDYLYLVAAPPESEVAVGENWYADIAVETDNIGSGGAQFYVS